MTCYIKSKLPQPKTNFKLPLSLKAHQVPTPPHYMRRPAAESGGGGFGLGAAAISYVAIDYLRHVSPAWHSRLQPLLWTALAVVAVIRVPFYRHWSAELRSALPFLASMIFMLSALLFEALSVRFVTAVLGLDWHGYLF